MVIKFIDLTNSSSIAGDATQTPGVPGYYALSYDDNAYGTSNQCNLTLVSPNTAQSVVSQDSTCTGVTNSGTSGIGQYAMFKLAAASGSTVANLPIAVQYNMPSFSAGVNCTPNISNLTIYGPGDFSYTSGLPLSLAPTIPAQQLRIQPLAIRCRRAPVHRLPAGQRRCRELQSSRAVGTARPHGFLVQQFPPRQLHDKSHDGTGPDDSEFPLLLWRRVRLVLDGHGNARGQHDEHANDPDAFRNRGRDLLRYHAEDRQRVHAVHEHQQHDCYGCPAQAFNGTLSTAATHASGATITLGNRWSWGTFASLDGGNRQVFEFVTSAPHGLKGGQNFNYAGSYPGMTCTDGSAVASPSYWNRPVWPTGPNTFALIAPATTSTCVTLGPSTAYPSAPTSYTLSGCQIHYVNPPANLPFELPGIVTSGLNCNLHLNLPMLASDSLVYAVAAKVLANTTAGRRVYVELCDEPWNFVESVSLQTYYLGRFNSTSWDYYQWYVIRAGQIGNIFRTVFGSRSGEIYLMLNSQTSVPSNGADMVRLATANNVIFNAYAINTYYGSDSDTASVAYCNSLLPQSGLNNPDNTAANL